MIKADPYQIDELTGLLNRKTFLEKFCEAMTTAKASARETPLSIALLDVDKFCKINGKSGTLPEITCWWE